MLLHNACGFERRILNDLRNFPAKLLLLARARPKDPCPTRKAIAQEILETENKDLEITARKLKQKFQAHLKETAAKGTLADNVYWILKGMSILWKADVRENERLNKMVKLMNERAPHSTTELKSARLAMKYLLGAAGEGRGRTSCKWSLFKPVAQRVRDHCLKNWDDLLEVQSDIMRWAPSEKASEKIPASKVSYLHSKINPRLSVFSVPYTWAASYNMVAHRALNERLAEWESDTKGMVLHLHKLLPVAFCVAVRLKGRTKSRFRWFVSAEVVRRKHQVLEVEWNQQSRSLSWHRLRDFRPLLSVIKDHFDLVRAGHRVVLMHAELTYIGDADGCVNTAGVGHCKKLVALESPAANFLKKCQGEQSCQSDSVQNVATETPQVDANSGFSASPQPMCDSKQEHVQHVTSSKAEQEQALGLRLLAEEAELMEKERAELQGAGDQDSDADDDVADGVCGNCNGDDDLNAAFLSSVAEGIGLCRFPGSHDDNLLEHFGGGELKVQASEELASAHEQAVAFGTILGANGRGGRCNLDAQEHQEVMQSLEQQMGLGPVEAALEVAFAINAGVQVVDTPSTDHAQGFCFSAQ